MVRAGGLEPPSTWPSTRRICRFSYAREWWAVKESNLQVTLFLRQPHMPILLTAHGGE
jgi:hypothetical protein